MAAISTMNVLPDLAALVANPQRLSDLPLEALPGIRAELARLDMLLQIRVMQAGTGGNVPAGDKLLSVQQAAAKLNISVDQLYRTARRLPFSTRIGRKLLFSEAGIERFIRQRMGRE